MLTIALVNPAIPPNTGTIARLCGATRTQLHIVGTPNFDMSDKAVKRAGLDYWHLVDIHMYPDIQDYFKDKKPETLHFLTAHASTTHTNVSYKDSDILVFGSETTGLPEWIHNTYPTRRITIPMIPKEEGIRSINLANAVSVVLYEALRQTHKCDTAFL
jgi:tRNA (cytidine/uridine-2'-O-)-methyltransferase